MCLELGVLSWMYSVKVYACFALAMIKVYVAEEQVSFN